MHEIYLAISVSIQVKNFVHHFCVMVTLIEMKMKAKSDWTQKRCAYKDGQLFFKGFSLLCGRMTFMPTCFIKPWNYWNNCTSALIKSQNIVFVLPQPVAGAILNSLISVP